MGMTFTTPGVYVREVPSPVRTIAAVPTAVAAFVGRARRGNMNQALKIHSIADFERAFGPLWSQSELGQAVTQYYLNGGGDAWVVRVVDAATAAAFIVAPTVVVLPGGLAPLRLAARSPGTWLKLMSISVDSLTRQIFNPPNPPATIPGEFNLTFTLTETDPVTGYPIVTTESYRNVTCDPASPQFIKTILENDSSFFTVTGALPMSPDRPADNNFAAGTLPLSGAPPDDGTNVASMDILDPGGPAGKLGLFALEDADLFNILVIPQYSPSEPPGGGSPFAVADWSAAEAYCRSRRAIVVVDVPKTWDTEALAVLHSTDIDNARSDNAAAYFPMIEFPDPLLKNKARPFAPAAAMAGVMARIDGTRGVWKSPAGEEAKIVGVVQLHENLTDAQNGDLNPIGVNCLRTFPIIGSVVWGARTLFGSDQQGSEWKYLAVRRTAYMIEESLFRGTHWVVFEPNDEPLWSQIRLNVGAFMRSLFRQGAFQGATPNDAYFVKCDADTTTQNDINLGIVNILVGFAPLKPAEFVVIKISQIAGNIQT